MESKRYRSKSYCSGNTEAYDVIVGYRADDSYFDFAEAFLSNTITVEQLSEALRLGKLGEQVVIKSEEAFGRMRYVGFSTADHAVYYPRRQSRNETAEKDFASLIEKSDFKGLYMNTILAEQIGNEDARLPRNTVA